MRVSFRRVRLRTRLRRPRVWLLVLALLLALVLYVRFRWLPTVHELVTMELEMMGIPMRLEPSPVNFRGLSHREWGDNCPNVIPILMEAGNPSQGRLRGHTNEALVLTGRDKAYEKAAKLGVLFIPYVDSQPLELRTARHVTAVAKYMELLGDVRPGKDVVVENIPTYEEMTEKGLGPWLAPAP